VLCNIVELPSCPKGWHSYLSYYYYVSEEERNWDDARARCQSVSGADLVSISDEDENNFVHSIS